MAGKKVRNIRPRSRPHRLRMLDGRTQEAALLRRTRAELTKHVGDVPSAVQRALIERIALLTLHVAMLDRKALAAGGLSEGDSRQYLAYSNSLSRALRQLGLKGAAAKTPTLAEHFAKRAAEKAA